MLVRVSLRPVREYEGEIFTDYYFGEANTANKLDNHHSNAINENFNWGRFPGCYSSLPPNEDLGDPGGREAGDDELITTNRGLGSMPTTNFYRDNFPQRDANV